MLLQDLYTIVHRGAERPLALWIKEYQALGTEIALQLEDILPKLHEDTAVKGNVQKLIALLRDRTPNELELAKLFAYVAEFFTDSNASAEHQRLIHDYMRAVKNFYSNAQTSEFNRQAREKLMSVLDAKQRQEYDQHLFQHEGMMYCLEYYLAIFKAMQDAKTEAEKRKFIESTEVNLGFGNVPGLWSDFNKDEVLGKFIYLILDNETRLLLTEAYYSVKLQIRKIHMYCDKQGKCEANYRGVTLAEIIASFKEFLSILLKAFQNRGIERLSSFFFTPYGQKPFIKDIAL